MSTWSTHQSTDVVFPVDRSRAVAPYAGVAMTQAMSAPKTAVQGITVPFAGRSALAAVVTDAGNPGFPPREAPV
jgi:hypothetical protein